MRRAIFALLALVGCRPVDDDTGTTTVLSHRGDPANFTSSGFPKHVYPIQNCSFELRLSAPFEVSEGGFGDADVRVPLAFLTDPSVKGVAPGGPNAQSRVSYAFPSIYRGTGMKEWFAQGIRAATAPPTRALERAAHTLASAESLKGDGTRGETRYIGALDGREVAMICSATDWPNPVCRAEVSIGDLGQRYLITFPPTAVGKMRRMVEIGEDLFSDAAASCRPN